MVASRSLSLAFMAAFISAFTVVTRSLMWCVSGS
jgi:hypothetical protein